MGKDSELLRTKLVEVANGFIGQKEIKDNAGFLTAWMDAVMRKAGFKKGYAWCMITVEAIYKTAITLFFRDTTKPLAALRNEVEGLINPSTQSTYNAFVEKAKLFTVLPVDKADYKNLKVGDIVIFVNTRKRAFGHAGIITKIGFGCFYCVEGNTNDSGSAEGDGVYLKRRTIDRDGSGLDVRGFLQLKDF